MPWPVLNHLGEYSYKRWITEEERNEERRKCSIQLLAHDNVPIILQIRTALNGVSTDALQVLNKRRNFKH